MQVLQLKTCVGKDGLLRLEIPTEWRNIDLEVCVVLNPLPKFEEASVTKVHPDYPEGFFERTIGKWEGEFEYLDQGIAEERDPLQWFIFLIPMFSFIISVSVTLDWGKVPADCTA